MTPQLRLPPGLPRLYQGSVRRPKLSVMITGQEVARSLPRVLASARRVADEIIFIDGGSRDATRAIAAREPRARVFTLPFDGNLAEQKNFGLAQCRGDWILVLDADELLADEFCAQLPRLMRSWTMRWYKIPRYWVIADLRPLRYIASRRHYPDYQLRLFRNSSFFRYAADSPVHVHFPKRARGIGRRLKRGHIFHLALAWTSRAERDERTRRYAMIDPLSRETNAIYLYEEGQHEVRECAESLTEEFVE